MQLRRFGPNILLLHSGGLYDCPQTIECGSSIATAAPAQESWIGLGPNTDLHYPYLALSIMPLKHLKCDVGILSAEAIPYFLFQVN